MGMAIYKVNETGIEQIRQFLLANHKRPQEATTDKALASWVIDAEVCADVMGAACVEIPAEDSIHGQAVEFRLDEDGLDVGILSDQC